MRILLATDGSPQARGAEALAEWLAYKLSAPLTVLFVVDTRLARIPELLDFGALTVPVPVLRTELERALALRGEAVLERVRQSALAAGVAVVTMKAPPKARTSGTIWRSLSKRPSLAPKRSSASASQCAVSRAVAVALRRARRQCPARPAAVAAK